MLLFHSIYEIGLTDEHAPLLVSLSNNRNLTHLDLGRNGISDNASGHIRDLIVNTSSLREIRYVSITKAGWEIKGRIIRCFM